MIAAVGMAACTTASSIPASEQPHTATPANAIGVGMVDGGGSVSDQSDQSDQGVVQTGTRNDTPNDARDNQESSISALESLSPIPKPTFPMGTRVAGVALDNLPTDAAATKLAAEVTVFDQPLELSLGQKSLIIFPNDLQVEVAIDDILVEAYLQASRTDSPDGTPPTTPTLAAETPTPLLVTGETDTITVEVPLFVDFDRSELEQRITQFARQESIPPVLEVITNTNPFSRSFGYRPGKIIDVKDAMDQVEQRLQNPRLSRRINLALRDDNIVPRATLEQIRGQAEIMAQSWEDVVALYLHDLESDEHIGIHENTVFSGASVMKVAILLFSYASLPTFDEEQQEWIEAMIIESDNLAANYMLAAGARGTGTEDALAGAYQMNDMLSQLGLQHTYQYMPYEAHDYLVVVRGIEIKQGPPQEGEPPYTAPDPSLRTTPREISQIFLWIDQCSNGTGPLLTRYHETLSPARCQEMLDLLARNGDDTRMRRGVPADVRVEHKSGWIEDMQADVGIVRSPNGDFVLGIFLYRDYGVIYSNAQEAIAGIAHMVYTAYDPVRIEDTDQPTQPTQQPAQPTQP
jgi:beta-lactamase class A